VRPRVDAARTASGAWRAFVEANVDFIDTHRQHLLALVDITAHARVGDTRDLRRSIAEVDLAALRELSGRGQRNGAFRRFERA
jgi:hypothetical protein